MRELVRSSPFRHDVVIVGGAGHVGLPLAIALADSGATTVVYDTSAAAVEAVNAARMPFSEPGAAQVLKSGIGSGRLVATTDPSIVAECENVVVVIGTPVDKHLNPDPRAIPDALDAFSRHFRSGQLVVLRSTVYPGVTALVEKMVSDLGHDIDVAFCPERIAEHKAMEELHTLPQIVSSRTARGRARAAALFHRLTGRIVDLEPEEAELAKLFTNTWRYIKFAAANQFFMMANDRGLDFERIRQGLMADYPRAQDMPCAGFAAGPCLFKDTMQLAAFHDNNFPLGHAAMLINEGLPLYLVTQMGEKYDLDRMTVGILGMSFKAESDDVRSSLSYKLRRTLDFRAKRVLTTDPYVTTDSRLVPLEKVLAESDLLVLATPHSAYRDIRTDLPVVDVWNFFGHGVVV